MVDFGARRLIVGAALLVSMACYTLQPVAGQPFPAGSIIALSINDAGRASLGGQMGPEISEIEGRLIQRDSTEYVLAVQQIRLLRGGEQVWAGERVRIKSEHVTGVRERRFSKGKTAMVSAATVGVVALIIKQGVLGSLLGDDGKPPSDTNVSIKYPRFIKR